MGRRSVGRVLLLSLLGGPGQDRHQCRAPQEPSQKERLQEALNYLTSAKNRIHPHNRINQVLLFGGHRMCVQTAFSPLFAVCLSTKEPPNRSYALNRAHLSREKSPVLNRALYKDK